MAIRHVNKETLFKAFYNIPPYLLVVFHAHFFWDMQYEKATQAVVIDVQEKFLLVCNILALHTMCFAQVTLCLENAYLRCKEQFIVNFATLAV